MDLKTDVCCNEYDFVQNGESMQELTVTITLCEYRELVSGVTRQENTIERLHERIIELDKQNRAYQNYIIANHPEIVGKIGDFATRIMNQITEKGGVEE